MKTALGIRFYEKDERRLERLKFFIDKASKNVDLVFVVINDKADETNASQTIKDWNLPKTEVFGMNVWGKYTPALNAIVYNSIIRGCDLLFFISPEIDFEGESLDFLKKQMDEDTLVTGAFLHGHDKTLTKGEHEASGTVIPWNTFAVWNLKHLGLVGFPLIGDAPFDPQMAGVEEVSTCAILQNLYPELKIKLVKVPSVSWKIDDLDKERVYAHIKKITSKEDRARRQMEVLGLKVPKVQFRG